MVKQRTKFKVVLAGGHAATVAMAVAEEIKRRKLGWELYFVGAKYAFEGRYDVTLEYEILPGYGIDFLPLVMGRLQTRFTIWTIPSILKIPLGFIQAFWYLGKIRPDVVLSFGAYSAVPVVFAAKILGIPVVIHEQTAAAGRANQQTAHLADAVALARAESRKYFPGAKIVVTGNPVSKDFFSIVRKTKIGNPPVIFVTGGSRGSQNLNNAVAGAIPKLISKYKLIHQTGEADIRKFEDIKKILPGTLSGNYDVFSGVMPDAMPGYLAKADLIIARAGANTVSDIWAARRPAILVPLPISYLDEQTENAKLLAKGSFAKIIKQKDLSVTRLLTEIESILSNYPEVIKKIGRSESPDKNAAKNLVDLALSYLK